MSAKIQSVAEGLYIFWSKIVESSTGSGCWEWCGSVQRGYGINVPISLRRKYKTSIAHRLSVILDGRKIPKGMHVDHLCRNTRCLNPKHLEVVTPRENLMRSSNHVARFAKQTHCKRGHPLSGKNLLINKSGPSPSRVCRACANAHGRRYDKIKREKQNAN